VGLRGDKPPQGYRHLTRADLTKKSLRTRLVAAHQARGGWGLAKAPLKFEGALVVAEGQVMVNGNYLGHAGTGWSGTIVGVYSAMDRKTEVPWSARPPNPATNATWSVSVFFGDFIPSCPCLLVRSVAPVSK
jgi:hypothetical protein